MAIYISLLNINCHASADSRMEVEDAVNMKKINKKSGRRLT